MLGDRKQIKPDRKEVKTKGGGESSVENPIPKPVSTLLFVLRRYNHKRVLYGVTPKLTIQACRSVGFDSKFCFLSCLQLSVQPYQKWLLNPDLSVHLSFIFYPTVI